MDKNIKESYSDLLKIIKKITSDLDIDNVLQMIIESAARLVNANDSSLLLIDDKSNRFYFKAIYGQKGQNLKNITFDINTGIAGWVVKERKPILVQNVSNDDRFNKWIDRKIGFTTESIICIPLEIKGRILGVLEIVNSDNRQPFTTDQFDLLVAFSEHATLAIENARLYNDIIKENRYLNNEVDGRYELITSSKVMFKVLETAKRAAKSDSTIMIYGESGTGKELIARKIHSLSLRKNKPFVVVNCATLSGELLESDLFGHEKGAFTSAYASKQGKLELADKGSFFFDEIAELRLPLQAKLLRVLQERCFEPVGSTKVINVDIRIICATNKDLEKLVQNGSFRDDLFYRLNVIPVYIPPLRQRKEDIPILVKHFVNRYCLKTGQKIKKMSENSLQSLLEYEWPGNVRELENIIERSIVLEKGDTIDPMKFLLKNPSHKPLQISTALQDKPEPMFFNDLVKEKKKEIILDTLQKTAGNQKKAAKLLNMQASYISKLIKELGINYAY